MSILERMRREFRNPGSALFYRPSLDDRSRYVIIEWFHKLHHNSRALKGCLEEFFLVGRGGAEMPVRSMEASGDDLQMEAGRLS